MLQGESRYETWVLTLRAWGQDPRVRLDHLPPLTSADFPPSAWSRFIGHLTEAQNALMLGFKERLTRLTELARTDFEFSQALTESRRLLRHRVELAHQPCLPAELQAILQKSCRTDIQRIQRELEEMLINAGRNAPQDSRFWGQRLLTVRQNPFTAVLSGDEAPGDGPFGVPHPAPQDSPARSASRWAHRRLL